MRGSFDEDSFDEDSFDGDEAVSQDHRALHARNYRHHHNKMNAAQKRQRQRDKRREWTNPWRTQREEDRERERKDLQAWRRGNRRGDPYHVSLL